jgi:hypothetical protein
VSLNEDSEVVRALLARLEERARALSERLDRADSDSRDRVFRAEQGIDRAVQVARSELERRLDILNHAHEQAVADRAQFVTRAETRWLIGLVVTIGLAVIALGIRLWHP